MSVAFLVTSLVIVVLPGTGALFTVAAGLKRGARAGVIAAFGCTLGIIPHLTAAVTGTAALLHAGGLAFDIVKVLGIAYLLYTAWTTWNDSGILALHPDPQPSSVLRVIGSAVLANLLNPKLTIFFFAFLPQFVPPRDPHPVLRLLELSAVFMLMTFVVFAGYGLFASAARAHVLERPRLMNHIRRAFAGSFLALSAKLATISR
jgi:threonine/homoserine/homoserine lactone efflux protein